MAGARPSGFKKGGGFLNNVDGVILGYEFTPDFPNPNGAPRKKSKSDFSPLYAVLKVQVDGAAQPVTTTLFVGSADDFEIEDDGHTLVPVEEGYTLWGSSEWARFIESMCLNGNGNFSEDDLPEDAINFEAIINKRVRFVQEKDLDKTEKRGKRKSKKTGKEYDQTQLVVSTVYPDAAPARGAGKSASAPRTVTKAATKPNGKAKEVDLTETADEALQGLLEKFGGEAPKAKLVSAPAQMFLKKNYPDTADEIRKMIYDDDYLNGAVEREVIADYAQADKAQTITAVA